MVHVGQLTHSLCSSSLSVDQLFFQLGIRFRLFGCDFTSVAFLTYTRRYPEERRCGDGQLTVRQTLGFPLFSLDLRFEIICFLSELIRIHLKLLELLLPLTHQLWSQPFQGRHTCSPSWTSFWSRRLILPTLTSMLSRVST